MCVCGGGGGGVGGSNTLHWLQGFTRIPLPRVWENTPGSQEKVVDEMPCLAANAQARLEPGTL